MKDVNALLPNNQQIRIKNLNKYYTFKVKVLATEEDYTRANVKNLLTAILNEYGVLPGLLLNFIVTDSGSR